MVKESFPETLRRIANSLRTKPMPLKDLIPLLQQAADEIEAYESILSGDEVEDGT